MYSIYMYNGCANILRLSDLNKLDLRSGVTMSHFCHTRKPDTSWSWLICFSASVTNALHFGFSQSFGVFLPILSDYFKENREKTVAFGVASGIFVTSLVVFLQSVLEPSKSAMGLGMGYFVSSIAVCGGAPFV
ncbi:hypothetical protein QZH41_014085, partial [Actinostola sp. cb2023]